MLVTSLRRLRRRRRRGQLGLGGLKSGCCCATAIPCRTCIPTVNLTCDYTGTSSASFTLTYSSTTGQWTGALGSETATLNCGAGGVITFSFCGMGANLQIVCCDTITGGLTMTSVVCGSSFVATFSFTPGAAPGSDCYNLEANFTSFTVHV